MKHLKRNKAPGEDDITADIPKDGGEPGIEILTKFFNRCLIDAKFLKNWKNTSEVILHKKGDIADIKIYRPISFLATIYKLVSMILLKRMLNTLDQH